MKVPIEARRSEVLAALTAAGFQMYAQSGQERNSPAHASRAAAAPTLLRSYLSCPTSILGNWRS